MSAHSPDNGDLLKPGLKASVLLHYAWLASGSGEPSFSQAWPPGPVYPDFLSHAFTPILQCLLEFLSPAFPATFWLS